MDKEPYASAPRGRPKLPAEQGKRHPLNIRTTRELKDLLRRAANSSGRSVAQEIEVRLEHSFRDEARAELFLAAVYGRQLAAVLDLLGHAARSAIGHAAIEGDWLADPAACARARGAVIKVATGLCPQTGPAAAEVVGAETARAWLAEVKAAPPSPSILSAAEEGSMKHAARAIREQLGAGAAERIDVRPAPPRAPRRGKEQLS